MPELRIDPIVGRQVYVAEERAGRPNDFVTLAGVLPAADLVVARAAEPGCPFCAGHEGATPHTVAEALDAQGAWQVRVVPNKFPAMTFAAGEPSAWGAHEVIIESPRHLLDVAELSVEQLAVVLGVHRDRLRHWAADGRLRHGLIFKNSGSEAGASLRHVHSQLAATPYVPPVMQAELDGGARFYQSYKRCVFCDLIEREMAAGERVVLRQRGFVAMCAYAGRQPLESWILPERHAARFDAADDAELRDLAAVLHDLLRRLEAVSPGAAYNLLLHSGPFDGAGADSFHWHWELIPRMAQLAGFEWGTGLFINPLSPEHAAERLRNAGR